MNIVKDRLTAIIGRKLPKTAVSFSTHEGEIVFINSRGKYMPRPLSKLETELLRQDGLFGVFGWKLTDKNTTNARKIIARKLRNAVQHFASCTAEEHVTQTAHHDSDEAWNEVINLINLLVETNNERL